MRTYIFLLLLIGVSYFSQAQDYYYPERNENWKENKRIYQQRCGKALGRYKAQAEKYIKSALSDNFLSNV